MSLRVTMTWAPATDPAALDVACAWADRLAGTADGSGVAPVCIWTTHPVDPPDHPAATRCCWHRLDLAPRVDRHAAHRRPDLPWSPWGTKSGPNVQFFAVLDAVAELHPEEWILYAEPDTVPVGPDAARHLHAAIAAHPTAWVVGALPHPRIRSDVDVDLRHHLNGAALYRVGDPAFGAFRTGVWMPSLLDRVRHDPEYAYDCLTDPAQWAALPPALATAWRAADDRLAATAGMINASTLTLTPDEVTAVLTDPGLMAALDREGVRPWLLHAKGPILDAARPPAPTTYDHVWGDLLDPLATAGRAADRVLVFLHTSKTGGTSLVRALEGDPNWVVAVLHPTSVERDTCSCGAPPGAGCVLQRIRHDLRSLDPDRCRGRSLAVMVGHEQYAAVRWVTDRLAERGADVDRALAGVRPTRARLVSAFTDFWTQVDALDSPDVADDPHRAGELAHYGAEAVRYRTDAGIDGPAWFAGFVADSGGLPFFLDEIYADPGEIADAVGTGRLTLVPVDGTDAVIRALTGATADRHRVSTAAADPAVRRAVDAAADVLDAAARRDRAFEAVIAEMLGDPGFHS